MPGVHVKPDMRCRLLHRRTFSLIGKVLMISCRDAMEGLACRRFRGSFLRKY